MSLTQTQRWLFLEHDILYEDHLPRKSFQKRNVQRYKSVLWKAFYSHFKWSKLRNLQHVSANNLLKQASFFYEQQLPAYLQEMNAGQFPPQMATCTHLQVLKCKNKTKQNKKTNHVNSNLPDFQSGTNFLKHYHLFPTVRCCNDRTAAESQLDLYHSVTQTLI